jgi:predicted RNase H-like HicB family nuclease
MTESIDLGNLIPEQRVAVRRYALVIEWSDEYECYLAVAPDLPGMVTHGRTRAEAAELGEEAVALWLHGRQSHPTPNFSALPDHLRPAPNLAGARRSA